MSRFCPMLLSLFRTRFARLRPAVSPAKTTRLSSHDCPVRHDAGIWNQGTEGRFIGINPWHHFGFARQQAAIHESQRRATTKIGSITIRESAYLLDIVSFQPAQFPLLHRLFML